MFGWLRPNCLLDTETKAWVEGRLHWLAGEFGADVFTRRAVIVPTDEFFPEAFDGSEDSVHTMYQQVCAYMDVDPSVIPLELFTERKPLGLMNECGQAVAEGAGGLFCGDRIRLNRDEIVSPMGLVATLAHELSHQKLIGEERIDSETFDNELLTDLTAIFHGFGVFISNSPRIWSSQYSLWPGTTVKKPEYLTDPMIAYGFAHSAWHRNDLNPQWAKHLNWSARSAFRHSLRYLAKTQNSSFKPQPTQAE